MAGLGVTPFPGTRTGIKNPVRLLARESPVLSIPSSLGKNRLRPREAQESRKARLFPGPPFSLVQGLQAARQPRQRLRRLLRVP